ncbi:Inherit from proNOG: Periplasmic binding protein LacI transcriptional regulator [Seminavis robusta]|uniref:Inherit from proNOG: Periplasmic binding protein LacI transcriptional regulator n=1 Tax=Seminavis robusta TaxID=568900 RepID=A0A9N8EYG5_9STRA|nr:Inherit from proNOG: Periplasmic binding protein LacI transcriptional regulator [Seminavis robusta]|eukprot:Sro2098_g314370.1 Inherit from proNOG: Periplasmic binding protein LacI transcriptional regulator (836) ;mRNA; r:3067-5574
MLFLFVLLYCYCCCTTIVLARPDIVAVLPDRSTAYPNGVHNGLLLTARRLDISMEIIDVGNFDPRISAMVLSELIQLPTSQQPKVYLIWPIDYPSRLLLQLLYETHQVPIIQMNQLPGDDSQWEWDHLLAYAGPDDALRASNAGKMMIQAMAERGIQQANIVALGYPETYGGYHLSITAFENAILDNNNNRTEITLLQKLPLDWGTQPAYEAVLYLLDTIPTGQLHGIYAMDDSILMGAYQAIQDHPSTRTSNNKTTITLVGTVCNGARELLETKEQYGTTVQSPYLEGNLAVHAAAEYLKYGMLQEPTIRLTPNPIVTADTWQDMFVDFQGQSYTADDLCTWSIGPYERVAGLEQVDDGIVQDVCSIVKCSYIPSALLYTGLALCGINYLIAAASAVCLYIYRNKAVIRLAQSFFLMLVVFGSMVDNTSIILMSRDNHPDSGNSIQSLDASCLAFPWVLALGHMMTTATLVAKIYRVKKLIGNTANPQQNFRKATVSVESVALFIVAFLSVDVVLLTAWSIVDPLKWQIEVKNYDEEGYIAEARGACDTSKQYSFLFPLFIALFHLATLIYANWLAYDTSAYHKISDSKNVAIALFNSIQLLVIVTPLLIVVESSVSTSYFIRVCFVFLNNFGVLMLVVVPKIWKCLQGKGDDIPDLHSMIQANNNKRTGETRNRRIRVSGLDDSQLDLEQYKQREGAVSEQVQRSYEIVFRDEDEHPKSEPFSMPCDADSVETGPTPFSTESYETAITPVASEETTKATNLKIINEDNDDAKCESREIIEVKDKVEEEKPLEADQKTDTATNPVFVQEDKVQCHDNFFLGEELAAMLGLGMQQ